MCNEEPQQLSADTKTMYARASMLAAAAAGEKCFGMPLLLMDLDLPDNAGVLLQPEGRVLP